MNDIDQRSQTYAEFCQTEHISKATLYDLLRRGLGPEVFEVPGTGSGGSRPKRMKSGVREWPSWRRLRPLSSRRSAGASSRRSPAVSQQNHHGTSRSGRRRPRRARREAAAHEPIHRSPQSVRRCQTNDAMTKQPRSRSPRNSGSAERTEQW